MKIERLPRKRELDYTQFIKRSALESDVKRLISEPTTFVNAEGRPMIIYDHLSVESGAVVEAIKSIKYHVGKRTRGLVSTSRIFGYRPRLAIRASTNFCSSTSLAIDYPKEHAIVCDFGKVLTKEYFDHAPELYLQHQKSLNENAKEEWVIPSTVFTSGIINQNNPLKYHFDTGNFKDVFSAMVVFKSGITGGYLSCPEYDMMFALPHNSVFLFDGQSILHGVTPIKRASALSFRYSIVYYSLRGIWKCLTVNEEIARVRNDKMKREKTRANMPEAHRNALLARFGKQ